MTDDEAQISTTFIERITRVEERVEALREAVTLAQRNSEIALKEAKSVINERLKLMNELRSVVEDQGKDFLRQSVYVVQHTSLAEKLNTLDQRLTSLESGSEGKTAGVGMIGTVVAGVAVVIGVIWSLIMGLINLFRH